MSKDSGSVVKDSPIVLVVDDDKSMRMLLRLALEQEGYQVVEAQDGQACISAYKQHQPDLILLDAVMPVMDGFDCCTQLRSLSGNDYPNLDGLDTGMPILMITALDDSDSVNRAFDVGTTDYITKPIQWSVLRYRVRRLIQQYLQARRMDCLMEQLKQANLEVKRLTEIVASDERDKS